MLFNLLSINAFGQTTYSRTKAELKEFRLGVGVAYTQWLNESYQSKLKNKGITSSPGFSILISCNYYPFKIDGILFDSKFKKDDNNYRFTGFEFGTSLQLNPYFKTVMPYVGLSYQWANLGNGFLIYGIKDEDSNDPLNVMQINGFYSRVGIDFNFRRIGIGIEYKNSFIKDFHNEQYNIFIFYK